MNFKPIHFTDVNVNNYITAVKNKYKDTVIKQLYNYSHIYNDKYTPMVLTSQHFILHDHLFSIYQKSDSYSF